MIRLDKFLADAGLGTRNEVKKSIKSRQVTINGLEITDPGTKVDESKDTVIFMGKQVVYEEYRYFMLNKPQGCVSATRDNLSETVIDILKDENTKGLFPVGRLDADTEGLLLITNDGGLAHRLLSPGKHVSKTYYVEASKELTAEAMDIMKKGVDIGDEKPTLPAQIEALGTKNSRFAYKLTICEGRFHQVKRMFEALNSEVIFLKRLSMGSLKLDEKLLPGEYRRLSDAEIEELTGFFQNNVIG